MAKANGIYERCGKHGDVTFYIRYQFQGTDIKERVGRRSRGFTRELAKEALKSRLGDWREVISTWRRLDGPFHFQSWLNGTASLRLVINGAGMKRNTL